MIAAQKYSLVVGDSEEKMGQGVSNLLRRKVIKVIIVYKACARSLLEVF